MDKDTRERLAAVVANVEVHFRKYLVLPDENYGVVLALWAIHTWCFTRFYSVPYLAFGGRKGSGKSTALDLLEGICMMPHKVTGTSPAAMYRKLAASDGMLTILYDEAEAAGSEKKDLLSQFLNAGYKRGGKIDKVVGNQVVSYPVFCPKAFAAIGDVNEALRTRCIPIRMERGQPGADYWPEVAESEAQALVTQIKWSLDAIFASGTVIAADYPEFLSTRDREIWGALFGLAKAFHLSKRETDRLVTIASDSAALKTATKVTTVQEEEREDDWVDVQYARRAVLDLARVLDESKSAIFTVTAVERMRAIPDAPWRKFKGEGLDPVVLANLVARHGLTPTTVRVKGIPNPAKGYKVAAIKAAAATIEGGR